MNHPPQPPPAQPPRMPQPPWHEHQGAPLAPDEIDDYDRMMAPERVRPKRKGPFFL